MIDNRLEYFRRRYAVLNLGWEHATARYQRWVARLLSPTVRVLDLGCGRGGVVERLHANGRWTGCDPDWLSLAEHRLAGFPRSLADAAQLPFADESFDLVVSSWVLEHLPYPDHTFREVARILRPEGRFVFLTPNSHHPIPRFSQLLARLTTAQVTLVAKAYRRAPEDAFPVHYRANTFNALSRLATQAGLRLVQIELVDDPSYFAWNELSFALSVFLEKMLPATWKVHIVGEYIKPLSTQEAM